MLEESARQYGLKINKDNSKHMVQKQTVNEETRYLEFKIKNTEHDFGKV